METNLLESWQKKGGRMLGTAIAALTVTLAAAPLAGAQTVDQPVSYEVGPVLVFASTARNPSCSVTRTVRNTGDVPVQVLGTANWDGQPDHLPPNSGQFDGDETLQPGGQLTAVWTNSGYVTDGPLNLTWSVIDPAGPDPFGVGANRLEPVPACSTVSLPSGSVPTTAASSDTSTTAGTAAAGPVEPLRTAPGPEAATTSTPPTTGASVLASSVRAELPATGSDLKLAAVGFMLAAGGVLTVGLSRIRSRADGERADRP